MGKPTFSGLARHEKKSIEVLSSKMAESSTSISDHEEGLNTSVIFVGASPIGSTTIQPADPNDIIIIE